MCDIYLQSHFYMSMLKVIHPVALILGAVSVQKCTLAVAFPVQKLTIISVPQRVLR